MLSNGKNQIYLISGPASVGKTTIAHSLIDRRSNIAYISGDQMEKMFLKSETGLEGGKQASVLLWYNMLSLTKNFIMFNIDVVIDYRIFPNEALWLQKHFQGRAVDLTYVILWSDENTLLKRDQSRPLHEQKGAACLRSREQFLQKGLNQKHLLDSSAYSLIETSFIANELMANKAFLLD